MASILRAHAPRMNNDEWVHTKPRHRPPGFICGTKFNTQTKVNHPRLQSHCTSNRRIPGDKHAYAADGTSTEYRGWVKSFPAQITPDQTAGFPVLPRQRATTQGLVGS
jgi:hypothetical protein